MTDLSTRAETDLPEDAETRADGELQPAELSYRLGLLAGVAVFFNETMGGVFDRGPLVLTGAGVMATLIVLTLATQWRVLGNWRCTTQQAVYLSLVVALTVPLAGLLKPEFTFNLFPEAAQGLTDRISDAISTVPGASLLFKSLAGFVAFLVYAMTLIVLVVASGPNQRSGFAVMAGLMLLASVLFYPNPETFVGIVFLVMFFRAQWERPLLISPRLRQNLTTTEIDYLRELVREGALSTGETKIFLNGDPTYFQRLMEFGFVEYDAFTRQILPGRRLTEDTVSDTLARSLGVARRGVWILFGLVYIILPDLMPGPVDDAIVMAICSGATLDWFKDLVTGRKRTVDTRRRN